MKTKKLNKNYIYIYITCFSAMIAVFLGLLTAVYSIDDKQIGWHQEYSLYVIEEIEENWESLGNLFGLHSQPGMMDNTTDRIMLEEAIANEKEFSALERALYMNGYTRYWHGYQVFLRPLLVFYQIHQIRYLNMFAFFGMLFAVILQMNKRMGVFCATAFLLCMICVHIVVIPMSMQYMPVFMVSLFAMLIILFRYPFRDIKLLPLFFMCIGMLINFLDLLTVPIVTLCLPLGVCLYIEQKQNSERSRPIFIVFSCSLAWGLGYGLCWISKWMLSTLVLDINVFADAVNQAKGWTMVYGHAVSRMDTVILNFKDYFNSLGIRAMAVPVAFLLILMIEVVCLGRREKQTIVNSSMIMLVGLFPYAWYFILMEHSCLHHWFTYRAQVATQFCVYLAMLSAIDKEKIVLAGKWMESLPRRRQNNTQRMDTQCK